MEVNGDVFLEELVSVGKTTWEANPSEINGLFTANHWGFDSLYESPSSSSLPLLLPSSYDCFSMSVKPDLDSSSFNEIYCPFEAIYPDLIDDRSSYHSYKKMETLQFPGYEDYSMSVAACRLESPENTEVPAASFNMGFCPEKKNKVTKLNGQPSKNLMAERRRRKRLNDRLSMLRSIVPKISKMDRTSILGDTIDYIKELLEKINKIREEVDVSSSELNEIGILKDLKQNDVLMKNSPKFEVERRKNNAKVEICCSAKPGLLLSTVTTLETFGLEIQQCVISCFNDFSLHAACSEDSVQTRLVSCDEIKQELFRNAGYGGMCL